MAAPVLSAPHRMRESAEFRSTRRRGRRAGTRTLVAFYRLSEVSAPRPARLGVVVGRSVGNAVVRNTVKRRLRHLARPRIETMPAGSCLVIQAQRAAAGASSSVLEADLEAALSRVSERHS